MVQPLLSSDFNAYDVVPDGELYLADFETEGAFDEQKFNDFVDRYVATDDRDVRRDFRGSMQYPVWKRVGGRIRAISSRTISDLTLKKRIAIILKNEFPLRQVSGSVEAEYEFNQEGETSGDYTLVKRTHASYVVGAVDWRQPLRNRLLSFANARLTGRRSQQDQDERTGNDSQSSGSTFFGSEAKIGGGIRTSESDTLKLSLSGNHKKNYDPPPDTLRQSVSFGGSGETRGHAWKRPLSLSANGSYAEESYMAPPPASGFLTKESRTLSTAGEMTYYITRLGFVLDGDYADTHSVGSYSKDDGSNWNTALLLQRNWQANYLRAGGGYGEQQGESTSIGSTEPVDYEGRNAHGKASGYLKLGELFSTEAKTRVNANDTEGTFNGWYPSWSATLSLQYTPKRWTNILSANYSGHHIDLNEEQDRLAVDASLSTTYRPRDWLKFKIEPSGSRSSVDGYQASESRNVKLKGNIVYTTPWDRLSCWLFSGIYYFTYEDATNSVHGSGWWAGAGAGVDIN